MKPQANKTKAAVVFPERLLESRAVQAIADDRSVLVGLLWLALRAWQIFFLAPNQDVKRYFDTSGQWLAGLTPYLKFQLEYPPGALVLFTLPRFLTDDFSRYGGLFATEMLLLDVAIIYLLWHLPNRLWGGPAAARSPVDTARRYDTALCVLAYLFYSALTGPLALERYDLCCSVIFLAWLYSATSQRRLWAADLILAVGVWTKLISIIVVPVYLVYLFTSSRAKDAETQPWQTQLKGFVTWLFPHGCVRLGCIVGFTVALMAPFYLMAGNTMGNFLSYHQQRGLQLESFYSSIFEALHVWNNMPLGTRYAFGCTEVIGGVIGSLQPLVPTVATASSIITVVALIAVSTWFGLRMLRAPSQKDRNFLLVNATLALVLAMIVFNKVLSPQYMLWLIPLAPLAALHNQATTRRWHLGFFTVFLLTALILQFYYIGLIRQEQFPVFLLLTRNVLLAVMLWVVCEIPLPLGQSASRAWAGVQRVVEHRAWMYAALGICLLWTFVANLSETTANDIWIQLRSGEDMVKNFTEAWSRGSGFGQVLPYTEVYSSTVYGRPFIAHEWLSGLIFHGLVANWGGAGLSFLAAFVAVASFILLYFAIDKEERHSLHLLCLLLLTIYLVSFRVLVRPHIFTIVAQSAMVLGLERWRRHGNWRSLAWFVPMQLVWVNLHGAALFGPALMGMLTGVVTLMVFVPALQRGSEVRTFTRTDIIHLGSVTTAMVLACLFNPYGAQLLQFSLDLLQNDYAKSRVWEWTSPFLMANVSYYWFWLYSAALALLWLSILARITTLPVLDIVLAGVVTFFSVRANRFVPDLAIFAFPIIARSFTFLAGLSLKPSLRVQRPWLEIGIAGLLLCNAVTYGYAHSAREHRPQVGWGFGGDMPYQEVEIIKKMGLRGIIFNEYSDGALIIHELVPQVRPVLDSRIDLYPWDTVNEYDQAYMSPDLFKQYVRRHRVNLVLLYRSRASPGVLNYLAADPNWQLLAHTNGRVLYLRRGTAESGTAAAAGLPPLRPL